MPKPYKFRDERRRSKKRRLCHKCSLVIPKGRFYWSLVERIKSSVEPTKSDFITTDLCEECHEAREIIEKIEREHHEKAIKPLFF